jgi:hypothetical protein
LRDGGGDNEITGVTPGGGDIEAGGDEFCIELAREEPPGVLNTGDMELLCPMPGGVSNGRVTEDMDGGSCRELEGGKEDEGGILFGERCGRTEERNVGPLIASDVSQA